jgi:hypothetical protein
MTGSRGTASGPPTSIAPDTRRDERPEVTMRARSARIATIGIATAVGGIALAGPASACGGLIGENGSISLVRTTTLAAWHDGVEHYVTSFEFDGTGESVGSIVPLPGEPTNVEAAGEWTLQRLQLEVQPPVEFGEVAADAAGAPASRGPRCCWRPRSTPSTSPS